MIEKQEIEMVVVDGVAYRKGTEPLSHKEKEEQEKKAKKNLIKNRQISKEDYNNEEV